MQLVMARTGHQSYLEENSGVVVTFTVTARNNNNNIAAPTTRRGYKGDTGQWAN